MFAVMMAYVARAVQWGRPIQGPGGRSVAWDSQAPEYNDSCEPDIPVLRTRYDVTIS